MTKQSSRFNLTFWLALVALALAVFAVFSRGDRQGSGTSATRPGLVENIDRFGKIRAGYGVFPPYTIEDPATHKVSGVAVDIINEIARQLGVPVEWKRFNWSTMNADLQRGEIDILADAIFETPQRGREFTFAEPYAFFAIGIGVVRRSETRFEDFSEVNDPNVRVAAGQGFAEETLVRMRAPRAQLISVPASSDSAAPVNEVLTGRADIAIVNLENARRFVAAHPRDLKIVWESRPVAYAPAAFAVRYGDSTGADLLNVSLESLRATGVLGDIARRYGVEDNFRRPDLK